MKGENAVYEEVKDLKIAFDAIRDKLRSMEEKVILLHREVDSLKGKTSFLHILIGKRLIRAETFSLIVSRIESRVIERRSLRCLSESSSEISRE